MAKAAFKIGSENREEITGAQEVPEPIMAGQPTILPEPVIIGADQADRGIEERVTMIVNRLEKLAGEQVTAKSHIEQRWLEDIRAFHGFYDSQTELALKEARQSRAFVKLTRAKTVTLEAKLFDLIFPTDDRNWSVNATPVPKLEKEAREAAQRVVNAAEQANVAEAQGNPQQAQQIVQEGNEEAARLQAAQREIAAATQAAAKMQEEMDDQLIESAYPQESRLAIRDACQIGTGILKGPVVNEGGKRGWLPAIDANNRPVTDAEGNPVFQLEQHAEPRPRVKRVDPWSFFPDMDARTIEEAEFTFERYLWTRSQLRKMVKTHGFNPDAVRRVLGDDNRRKVTVSSGLSYLIQLRSITGEGEGTIKGRHVGWEYHGTLQGSEIVDLLRAMGDEAGAEEYEKRDDPLDEMRVIAFFCDGELLKIAPEYPLDSGETLYSVFNLEESEGSMFGYGIPNIMNNSQRALNSVWRAGLDNTALSVGPQVVIDKESIVPQDGSWAMTAKKVWYRIKSAIAGSPQPIEFFNVTNNVNEIAAIVKMAIEFIDMETGIPMPQQGEQGAHTTQTVGGMAILQNAANVIFRRIVKNYDDGIITPTMRRLYDWNMQFSKRAEIKGDMSVDARGTSVLLVREIQAQNLMFVVANLLANPNTAPMLKAYPNVRKLFQSMMINPEEVMETEDTYKENLAKQAEQAAQQKDPATIQAESRVTAAQIQADSRRASDENGLLIAESNFRSNLIALASKEGMTVEQLRAELDKERMRLESGERKLATEIGVEMQMAEDARAHGERPTGSGGAVSAGTVEDTDQKAA